LKPLVRHYGRVLEPDRPETLGRPFTHWGVRKLAAYLRRNDRRIIRVGRERLRQLLYTHQITFQRTRTWKESRDPDKDRKLDRIEEVIRRFPDRCFAFDQFGPLSIRPCHGTTWAPECKPARLPATFHRTHGIRYFHGCYSLGDDQLWGVSRRRKGAAHTLSALRSIRAGRPDGAPIYVILDNLSANKTPAVRAWAKRNKVELCFTPTNASWPTRSRLRAAAHLRDGRVEPPQPRHPGTQAAGLSALAQRQRPPPRRPRRATPRTCARPHERQQRWGRPRAA
jgi:hypothetical protein